MKGSEMTVGRKYRLIDPQGCAAATAWPYLTVAECLHVDNDGADMQRIPDGEVHYCCHEWEELPEEPFKSTVVAAGVGVSVPKQEPVSVIFEVGDLVEVVSEDRLSSEWKSREYTSKCGQRGTVTATGKNAGEPWAYVDFGDEAVPFYWSELIFVGKAKDKSEPREESSAGESTSFKIISFVNADGGPIVGDPTIKTLGHFTPYKTIKSMSTYQKISRSLRKMLDPDTKTLVKAGYLNEELSLTGNGQQVLLEILKGVHKKELVAEAKADLKFAKESAEESA